MQSNQSQIEDSGIDYLWVCETHMHTHNVLHTDLKPGDYRHDNVRLGYWIKTPSQTATILGLRGCRFLKRFGQTNW